MFFPYGWMSWDEFVATMLTKMTWVVENGLVVIIPWWRRIEFGVDVFTEEANATDEAVVE